MKYIPKSNIDTNFTCRMSLARPQDQQINELGSVNITQPTNLATGVSPTGDIIWNALPDFSRYRIIVIKNSDGSEVINTTVVNKLSYTPSFDVTTGYKIQVFASRKIDSANITPSSITNITIRGTQFLRQNDTINLSIDIEGTGYFSSGINVSSSDDLVATVDNTGLVTHTNGAIDSTVVITASSVQDPTKTDTFTVNIIGENAYVPQDSQIGDEVFMQAFWDATQGQNIESVANEAELENVVINHHPSESKTGVFSNNLEKRRIGDILYIHQYGEWVNKGRIWFNREGWVDGAMDLSAPNITGITTKYFPTEGEYRIVEFDMAKEVLDYVNNPSLLDDDVAVGGNNLAGTLPPEWGNLTKCKKFNVKQNHFTGEIPDTLQPGNLLERLSLGGQKGEIPIENNKGWFSWNHSGVLDGTKIKSHGSKRFEWSNEFSSALPVSLRHSLNIDLIEMRMQYLTGDLPPEWSVLRPRGIFLNDPRGSNCLGGPLPPEWGDMNPDVLKLNSRGGYSGRLHTGEIPSTWDTNWTNIYNFDILGNDFSGNQPAFPNALGKEFFDYTQNNFDPGQPADQFFLDFFKDGNSALISKFQIMPLSGDLPELPPPNRGDADYYNFAIFSIIGHGYTGEIPQWVLKLNCKHFKIADNNFTSGFPYQIVEDSLNRLLVISNFRDENAAPVTLPDCNFSPSVNQITALNNNFIGNFPQSWDSLVTNNVTLPRFDFMGNELSGVVPPWFASIPTLTWLILRNNRYTYSDLLPNYESIKQHLINEFVTYPTFSDVRFLTNPQKPFFVPNQTLTGAGSVTVDLSSIDYTNNVYEWQVYNGTDWVAVAGQTGMTTHTLTTNVSGTYRLRITNADMDALANTSNPDHLLDGLEESVSQEITVTVN